MPSRVLEMMTRCLAAWRGLRRRPLPIGVILTLEKAIAAKDAYTGGHSLRVARYSRELAARAGLRAGARREIYCAALLHDIGKIGVPDAILNKAGRLSAAEYEIVKAHARNGADILSRLRAPSIWQGARWHHERYDGKGYPDGISGEQIPLCARIIGIADAYDALTSRRSYREILPQAAARAELLRGRGTQFDPALTDIMLAMMAEDAQYQMREGGSWAGRWNRTSGRD